MDENENPHCSASRQFSKLGAIPNDIGARSSPDFSEQWTQFSGISSQADQAAFKNICSWNPMDMPDFTPLSDPLQADSIPSRLTDFGVFDGGSDFLNHSQLDWHINSASSQVREDFAGRLPDVAKKRIQSCSFDSQSQSSLQHDFQKANRDFVRDDFVLGSKLHSSFHNNYVGLGTSDFHSQSGPSSKDHLSRTQITENVLPRDGTPADNAVHGRLPSDISVENRPHLHFAHTPPPLIHNTAYPFSTHKKQSSDNFSETSSYLPNVAQDDFTAYLQMHDQLSVNLDAGVKTSRHRNSNVNSTFISTEECRPYTTDRQWNLLNHNKMKSSDNKATGQTQPRRHQLSSEAAFSADFLKPSYSEVAKTPKNGPTFGAKFDHFNGEGSVRNTFVKTLKKDDRSFQSQGPLLGSKSVLKCSLGEETDKPRLAATSKYGLDSFTAQSGNHKICSENLGTVLNKRESDNSVTSSVNGLDEITLQGVANHASSEKNVFDPVQEVKSPLKQSTFTNTVKPPLSSKLHSYSSPQTAPKKDLFFDPKRIFQYENKNKVQSPAPNLTLNKTRGVANTSVDNSGTTLASGTILNNGKPAASTASSKLSSNARQHDYINNDLRDTGKLTNQTAAAESGQGAQYSKTEELSSEKESRLGKKLGKTPVTHHKGFNSNGDKAAAETSDDGVAVQSGTEQSWLGIDRQKIEKWCRLPWYKLNHYGSICITTMLKLLIILLWIILYFASGAIQLLVFLIGKSWAFVKGKMFNGSHETKDKKAWPSNDFLLRNVGLEENISLPATGEEAMKRLLACKGQDPYSILGLRADSSNEDIKKYYRKQAVLVHPDKNQEPGAEEAFKILGHAIEMIGEPEKRKQYDSHTLEANEVEAMKEFADMLSKLQAKIREAANTMPCDNCRGKHKRVPVERPAYHARFCERCNTRHSAKEGDVWAESTILGFYWHYFALMEGHVFDITEWMKCHEEYFNHMKANSHTVMYKIATEGNRRNRHHQQGDPSFEDLLNQIFKSSTTPNGRQPPWGTSHPGSEKSSAQGGTHEASATAAAAKKSRRKKKRH
ncbi:hypothetical protein BsWGS_19766 [Bradybaena similaris]